MRIETDRTTCEGLGMCEAMAPDFFEVGADGTVVVLEEHPGEEHRQDLTAAVDASPVLALRLKG
ncbi:ferredoxin [Prauserella muralis]|uniref:Ferredoxin n=1 Tax=Prauserella muralis TaxID=588067 RepID=A0A2V4ADS4_9PSEU|nr:ferredoxin [Prauserella muralis]PXY17468.1 ferredoxin [Prauserella muralis]TWE23584.1 ferredoxin [Prauserella muralis]